MSGRIVGEVLACAPTDLTPVERLVFIVLAENARDRSRTACLPAEDIAEQLNVSRSAVHKALSHLRRSLLIRTPGPAHKGRTQRYTIPQLLPAYRAVVTHHDRAKSLPVQEASSSQEASCTGRLSDDPQPSRTGNHSPVDNADGAAQSLPVADLKPSRGGRPLRTTPVTISTTSETKTLTGTNFTQPPLLAAVQTDPADEPKTALLADPEEASA